MSDWSVRQRLSHTNRTDSGESLELQPGWGIAGRSLRPGAGRPEDSVEAGPHARRQRLMIRLPLS